LNANKLPINTNENFSTLAVHPQGKIMIFIEKSPYFEYGDFATYSSFFPETRNFTHLFTRCDSPL